MHCNCLFRSPGSLHSLGCCLHSCYLHIVADQAHPLMAASFPRITVGHVILQKDLHTFAQGTRETFVKQCERCQSIKKEKRSVVDLWIIIKKRLLAYRSYYTVWPVRLFSACMRTQFSSGIKGQIANVFISSCKEQTLIIIPVHSLILNTTHRIMFYIYS